jgi:hypothetical protein
MDEDDPYTANQTLGDLTDFQDTHSKKYGCTISQAKQSSISLQDRAFSHQKALAS